MTGLLWVVAVAVGGAGGTVVRHVVSERVRVALATRPGRPYPWATLYLNAAASLLLGVLVRMSDLGRIDGTLMALLAVGFCGGLSAVNTFALEAVHLIRRKARLDSAGYILLSVAVCGASALMGLFLPALWS